ncbi:MAG: hypothetical protein ACE14M_12450 [Terriglobales bacterium]
MSLGSRRVQYAKMLPAFLLLLAATFGLAGVFWTRALFPDSSNGPSAVYVARFRAIHYSPASLDNQSSRAIRHFRNPSFDALPEAGFRAEALQHAWRVSVRLTNRGTGSRDAGTASPRAPPQITCIGNESRATASLCQISISWKVNSWMQET